MVVIAEEITIPITIIAILLIAVICNISNITCELGVLPKFAPRGSQPRLQMPGLS